MKIIKRGKIVYYVKDESVIVGINNFQYISYNVYSLQNRKPFYDFRRAILKSNEDEYGDAIELIKLGQKYNLRATTATKPSENV